eukprot:g7795.t1
MLPTTSGGVGERFGAKDAGCHIDHSAGVLSRLYDLVGSDTCDVVFCCTSVVSTGESDPPPEQHGGGSDDVSRESRQGERERQAGGLTAVGAGAAGAAGAAPPAKGDGKESAYGVDEPTAAVDRTLSTPCSSPDNGPTSWCSSPSNRQSNASKEFRCHRVLFASCSEYFRALLYGGMSESETRRVELRDVAPEGFEAIVTYVYTGRVWLAADNVMDIFSLAHRFGMGELLRACAKVLDECMNCDDVCRVLEAVEYYQDEVLEARCWDLIKDSTPRVLKSESFLELRWPLVLALVREGELQVDEVGLFEAVQAWVSRNPAERRRYIDELARHFRLPLMSLRDLMSVVRPSKLVAADSILDAVTYHADPNRWLGDPLMVRPRGKRFKWDASSLAAGAWTADDNRTVTTSVADWIGVYGDRTMRSGFHRWSVRANKVGRSEKKAAWGAVIGVARPQSQNSSRPYLPVTGLIIGTGNSKLGGNTAVDDYATVSVGDGDVVTVVYDADGGVLSFFVNQAGLGEAYSGMSGPMVAALAVNAAGAMWEMVDWGSGGDSGGGGNGGKGGEGVEGGGEGT